MPQAPSVNFLNLWIFSCSQNRKGGRKQVRDLCSGIKASAGPRAAHCAAGTWRPRTSGSQLLPDRTTLCFAHPGQARQARPGAGSLLCSMADSPNLCRAARGQGTVKPPFTHTPPGVKQVPEYFGLRNPFLNGGWDHKWRRALWIPQTSRTETPLPRPLSVCRGGESIWKKCTKLMFEDHRPNENLHVVALVVPSAPHSSLLSQVPALCSI